MLRRRRMLFFAVALSAMSACGADKPQVVATESSVVYDFTKQAVALGWSVQNDTVMGGVSESSNTWANKQMVFSGNLSLENNGGFVSSFGPVDEKLPSLMNGATTIRLRATGDGNTYLFQLRGNDGTNFIQRFTTAAEKERVYELPLSSFTATDRFLYEMADSPPLNTSNVYQMGLYLLDKQTGPFSIAISSIGVTS